MINNATYFTGNSGHVTLKEAWRRYHEAHPGCNDQLAFAQDAAIESLDFVVGQIVEHHDPNHKEPHMNGYATVTGVGYGSGAIANSNVEIQMAHGPTFHAKAWNLSEPSFPPGLVELLKSQMRDKCPLKEAGCA